MNNMKIITYATKYFLAVLITMYVWRECGTLITMKNNIANITGFVIFFFMSVGWSMMIKRDIIKSIDAKFNKQQNNK